MVVIIKLYVQFREGQKVSRSSHPKCLPSFIAKASPRQTFCSLVDWLQDDISCVRLMPFGALTAHRKIDKIELILFRITYCCLCCGHKADHQRIFFFINSVWCTANAYIYTSRQTCRCRQVVALNGKDNGRRQQ